MIKLMPMLEAYATANIATQNLFGGNPIQVLLGDLNTSAGSGAYGALMGPQPGVITVKEMLTGSMNQLTTGTTYSHPSGKPTTTASITVSGTSPLDAVAQNFQDNLGNIVVGTVLTTAGFRIANKVLSKPKAKFNKMIRQVGLGSTIQI
jgi:hypothetical protein